MRTRIPGNVERGGQMASTSFNIRDNKRNVEQIYILNERRKVIEYVKPGE